MNVGILFQIQIYYHSLKCFILKVEILDHIQGKFITSKYIGIQDTLFDILILEFSYPWIARKASVAAFATLVEGGSS